MIGDANGHGWGHRSPPFGRTAAFGGYGRDNLLAQATVRPTEMIIAKTEMKLTFHPIVFLGEAQGLTSEASVLMTHGAVLTFYEGRIEMLAKG